MKSLFTIGNFNVRLVQIGEKYGNGAVNNYKEPIVEFTDKRYTGSYSGIGYGQPVSSYMVSTLVERNPSYGLDLYGGEPEWKVDVAQMKQVMIWLNEQLLQSVEF